MADLLVLECIIGILLFISLIRPYIKYFQDIDGLYFLSLLALLLCVGLTIAFGFRPECVPLFIVAILLSLLDLHKILLWIRGLRNSEDSSHITIFRVLLFLLLFGSLYSGIRFIPVDTNKEVKLYTSTLLNDMQKGRTFFVRIYGKENQQNPVMLVVPPLQGSVQVVDTICSSLYKKGFTVITYSRAGLDIPAYDTEEKSIYPSFKLMIKQSIAFIGGTKWSTAAQYAVYFENERYSDLQFLIDQLYKGALTVEQPHHIYLAGYGAGAAAVIRFMDQEKNYIHGGIAIEGPLCSALEFEKATEISDSSFWSTIQNWYEQNRPKHFVQCGVVPIIQKPVLFLVSDTVTEPGARDGRYMSIIRMVRAAHAPVILGAITGAGPFDYGDTIHYYPIYTALMPGNGPRVKTSGFYPEVTASLINNFCTIFGNDGITEVQHLPLEKISTTVHLESGGIWTSITPEEVLGK